MKTFLGVAAPLVVLGLVFASFWYEAYRLRTLFELTQRWPLRIGVTVLMLAAMTALLGAASSESRLIGALNVLGGYVFTFYLFTLLLLLAEHAVELWWTPPRLPAALTVVGLALVITTAGALNARSFGVHEIEIPLPGLQQDVMVMHISDVHIGHHRGRDYLAQIVAETKQRKPQLVMITGDLVDSNVALLPGALEPLAELEAPVYFVNGNHDNYVDRPRLLALLEQHGVRALHNEVVDAGGFYLVGLDYMNPDDETFEMHPSEDTRTIKDELPKIELAQDKPAVLLHHSPVGAKYVAAKGVGLMLSGHTHAGQVFPGTLFGLLIFAFNKGLHQEGALKVFVSRGAGTFMPRVRLGSSNEINLLTLKAAPM